MTRLPARTPRKLIIPAPSIKEAWYVLDPEPLDFANQPDDARRLYIPHPARLDQDTGMAVSSPSKALTKELLKSTFEMKAFLSGHVGSGKSTELRKVAASDEIKAAFFPIMLQIEAGYWDVLDISQLQYLMACAVYDYANAEGLLNHLDLWKEPFRALYDSFARATKGTTSVELDFVFVKLKQDLKLGEYKRSQLRDLDRSRPTLLKDLVTGLVGDMEASAVDKGEGREPVLFIDDLDKVRSAKAQDETFRAKPAMLFDPPLRVVYTVPTGVAFNHCPEMIRSKLLHLYPAPALYKAPGRFDPEEKGVANDVGVVFLETALNSRVAPNLFTPDAVRKAAIYSGGMLRNFFRLLRTAIDIAEDNDRTIVDGAVMRLAVKSARLNESMSLHKKQYETLAEVHRTNFLADGDAMYLDQSWVFECFNNKVWYEANPLLWTLLDPNHK